MTSPPRCDPLIVICGILFSLLPSSHACNLGIYLLDAMRYFEGIIVAFDFIATSETFKTFMMRLNALSRTKTLRRCIGAGNGSQRHAEGEK
jgi:hypothetical protein